MNKNWRDDKKAIGAKISALLEEAREAFNSRPLPKQWKVGQKVRYLRSSEWAWNEGEIAYVVQLRDEYKGKKASEYQVFYTGSDKGGKGGTYWTTPTDVELVEDVD